MSQATNLHVKVERGSDENFPAYRTVLELVLPVCLLHLRLTQQHVR